MLDGSEIKLCAKGSGLNQRYYTDEEASAAFFASCDGAAKKDEAQEEKGPTIEFSRWGKRAE